MKRHSNKILFGTLIAAIIVVAGSLLFFSSRFPTQEPAQPDINAVEISKNGKKSLPAPVRQIETSPQEYGQNLYLLQLADYQSASLTKQLPFIAEQLEVHYDDDGPVPSNFPSVISIADISIPSKKLRLLALYDRTNSCDNGFCAFSVYAQKPDGWQVVMSRIVSPKQYILVDEKSVSLILCSKNKKEYRRYQMPDGRLDKPITVTDGEYFAFAGAFKHDKIASCP